jgi:heme/copper-type cytochrome/quinol oxidase subunit 1
VFFFLVPSIPAVLGNFLLPMMLGARDVAFPRLNLASWYVFMLGGLLAISAIVAGGADTGWTFYTPYSSTYSNTNVIVMALGIFVAGFSSILTGINFIVTIHTMRAPGLTWFRLPLFVWAHYATSLIMVLGTPVLAIENYGLATLAAWLGAASPDSATKRRRAAIPPGGLCFCHCTSWPVQFDCKSEWLSRDDLRSDVT